ncbi:serine/threonine-protein kinase [Pseudarthrobacter sp. MM222]|uniref:serine/threonine-protein kinase n=1 Tax=Pseudarthrobacter sp. MM222 TaxID=3018929 RepID=UPI00221ECFE7|nr:serine/threonine-protein kinase [Pseudarthrobacter sp. MM222]CAI3796355.1 Serine/threonine-protein kinase PknD [Pseudarthrobacter sp. MM222]
MEDFARPGAEPPAVPGYDVGRCLGRGGSATVWLATERSTGRDVALKCFAPGGGATGEGTEPEADLRREVRILSALNHDHLVRAHAVVRLDWAQESPAGGGKGLGLVLDYAPGGSLAALVAARGRLNAGETVTVLTPIAQALAYLHTHGVTHGDLAPGNVLFSAHGKPLLADLGVARMVADAATTAEHGTDGFRDPAPVDAMRAGLQPERDVYSLAALGWYCLSGRAPEPGDRRPPLPLLVPGVPAALAAALEAGLGEDRRLRPTAAELATAVYRSAAAEPVDLSGSVHPTVIPELLTRHAPPRTPRELRAQRLHGWSRHITRRIRRNPAAVPVRAAAPPRPAARHAAGRNPDGHGRSGSARAGRVVLRLISAVLALVMVLAGASLLAGARLPWPFPAAPTPGPEQAAEGRSSPALPGAAAPEAAAPAAIPQDIQALLRSEDPAEAVRGLARLRSLALNSGDLHLLDEVNAPESPAADADGRIGARLRQSGHVLTGFSSVLGAVERATDSGPLRTVLAVRVAQSAYQERDARGAIVAEAGAADEQRLRLVLVPVNGRWRIHEILPGRPSPG